MAELSSGKFFKWLIAFHAVAEKGSVSEAAKKLEVSQPAVSYLVHTLEAELGVELFVRRQSSVVLTNAGQSLYVRADALLKSFNEFRTGITSMDKSAYRGEICLSTTHSFAVSFLPAYVARFKKSNPEVSFAITSGMDSQTIVASVVKAEVDFGITSMERIPENVLADFLFRARLVLIAPRGWDFTTDESGVLSRLSELDGMPFLVRTHSVNVKRYIDRHLLANGIRPDIVATVNNYNDIRAFVRSGVGCSIVEDFESGYGDWYDVHALPFNAEAGSYYIIRGRRKYMSPQASAFIRSILYRRNSDVQTGEEKGGSSDERRDDVSS